MCNNKDGVCGPRHALRLPTPRKLRKHPYKKFGNYLKALFKNGIQRNVVYGVFNFTGDAFRDSKAEKIKLR